MKNLSSTSALIAALLLTTAVPAFAITPEQLFQEAKKHCDASATTAEGWAEIRKCIAREKRKIIRDDPRIVRACEKYSGEENDQCTDWNYQKPNSAAYSPLRYKIEAEKTCAGAGCVDGGRPGERTHPSTERKDTPGGVIGGRNTSPRASANPGPRSNHSTITGPTTANTLPSGGTTQRINRPAFLGGGYTGGHVSAPAPTAAAPSVSIPHVGGGGRGGVTVNGQATQNQGTTGDTKDDVLKIDPGVAAQTKPQAPVQVKPAPKVNVDGLKDGEKVD
jgi:hypothetical protein